MSFQRIGGPAPRKRSSAHRKPVWDDSVHDLTVYKATPDEIMMRKESHKSKNHMSVKLEKMRKENEKTVLTGAEAKQLAIMKEVLYDQQQLQKIIAKSDKMMAVVKDIFGDDPKRFTGFPNVTSAPKAASLSQSLVAPAPEIYTRTEKLSDSVMSASALNDVDTNDSDANSDGLKTPPKSQQSAPLLSNGDGPQSAINDTTKVNKTRKKTKTPALEENGNSSMADMRKALQDLEQELNSYEHQMGHRPREEKDKSETFSGYTVSLVNAVSRLTRYLKETQLRLKTEFTLREQLTEEVLQLRTIIDALATDIIMTQEEYAKLYAENQRYRETTAEVLHAMKNEMQEVRALATGQSSRSATGEKTGQTDVTGASSVDKDESNNVRSPSLSNSSQESSKPSAADIPNTSESKKMDAKLKATAILLSPPVRKTRVARDIKGTKHISGSPQNPSVIESICVPRPIPLVQSNLPVNLNSVSPTNCAGGVASTSERDTTAADLQDLINLGDQTQEQLNCLQEMAVEEMLNNPSLQGLMQTQIAELNRQQEEARMRLQDLLANQKVQQQHLQEQLGSNILLEGGPFLNGNDYEKSLRNQVSPPISPISQGSEKLTSRNNIPQILSRGQGITLSLPMVDLDVSTGSLTSH